MPRYVLVYQQQGTTEQVQMVIEARRSCDARERGRHHMNARRLDPIAWPLIVQTVEST